MSKNKKYVWMFMLFLAMNFFLLFYQNYAVIETRQMFISNRLYSTWSAVLTDIHIQLEEINEYLPEGGRIFIEHTDDGNIRSFYQNGNWMPPMMSGKFFIPNTRTPQAVIGTGVKSNLEDAYITVGDVRYEIVGVLGAGYPSPLDHLVLLNDINNTLPVERIVIDTDHISDIKSIDQSFKVQSNNESQAIERFLNSNTFQQLVVINVSIISLLLITIAGFLYVNFYEKNFKSCVSQ